jgi:branched-chain amino acid transport system ATP-binding protein
MMLEARALTVAYGGAVALEDVSIRVEEGEFVAIIGANGAGKTTLMNSIMGLLPVRSGSLRYLGHALQGVTAQERVALGIALVSEDRDLFATMTVEDNLRLGGYRRRGAVGGLDEVYDLFPRLLERRRQLVRTLSGGEQQMVAVGRALMSRPRLLLLDEPSMGLAPIIVRQIFDSILALRRRGITCVLVEQNAALALSVASRGYVMRLGRITAEGPATDLSDADRLSDSYLGIAV